MIKLFKRTRNYLHSLLLKYLLWFMRNVWTNPTFMYFINFLYIYCGLKKVILLKGFNHSLLKSLLIGSIVMWKIILSISIEKGGLLLL